jgi:hypothetical protein
MEACLGPGVKAPEGHPPPRFGEGGRAGTRSGPSLGILRRDVGNPGAPWERYQVVVHADAPGPAYPDQPRQSVGEDATHVPAGTCRRLGCDP